MLEILDKICFILMGIVFIGISCHVLAIFILVIINIIDYMKGVKE